MTRTQILFLVALAMVVCVVFCVAAVLARPLLMTSATPAVAEQPKLAASLTLTPTPTSSPIPTSTFTPLPTATRLPTPTYTRVVVDTATPTPSSTPTPTPTETPIPTRQGGGSSSSTARPTPTPTSRYPFKILEGPLAFKTRNHFLVIYAKVTSNDILLPGYRIVGTHSPTGAGYQGPPSCDHVCRANGPPESMVQEGNLVFEAPFYKTGTWSLMLIDPQGQQTSEVFKLEIDDDHRQWFYYRFGR